MTYEELGFLALRKGDFQEAINLFRRALEKGGRGRSYLGLGHAFFLLDDLTAARWAFNKCLASDPGNEEAITRIAAIEAAAPDKPCGGRGSLFRVGCGSLEVHDGRWKKLFLKGMNLGLGIPGHFPGEFEIRKTTYFKWFGQIADLGVNVLRLYTIHPPAFYEALCRMNESGRRLYLLQGIWSVLPEGDDFYGEEYLAGLKGNIRDAIDVVHGNTELPRRPGCASGRYRFDVSQFTVGFIFGREWESCAVRGFNDRMGREPVDHEGRWLSIRNGTPFEVWVTKMCDFLKAREREEYGHTHPVSVTSWPTLDPLVHPSESTYEDQLARQGLKVRTSGCDEDEDVVSLNVSKIESHDGSGFFGTLHAYPYYPDFMNNDYLEADNTYRAYLDEVKNLYGDMPVLIAEFGVPSSREVSHWHRGGWHHGGHSDVEQGRTNGLLIKTIFEAGMAGGVLFAWQDEWFKRNWLFFPYEIPAERNPLWYNLQDPEQNFGLVAQYPGYPEMKVSLSGRVEEWGEATTIYEKTAGTPLFHFNDGFDGSRSLSRLSAQHDEGFLYLLLETGEAIDFSQANYIVGLDTTGAGIGESLLPFHTEFECTTGLTFLLHLSGLSGSRILVCPSYDKYLNAETGRIRPEKSDQGEWAIMQNRTNARRLSKDGTRFYPSRVFSMSNLRHGTLKPENDGYDSLSDFHCSDNRIEIRIPWGLINFTDPSSGMVLWKEGKNTCRKTGGIRFVVASYKPATESPCAVETGLGHNATDHLPERLAGPGSLKAYTWEGWDTPVYHTYIKESYYRYREALSTLPEVL